MAEGILNLPDSQGNVESLLTALQDSDAAVRAAAATALGSRGDMRACEPLVNALWDSHHAVRVAAMAALQALGDPTTSASLIAELREQYSAGTRPVHSVKVTTKVQAPKCPDYCVGCGGPPPLVAPMLEKTVQVRFVSGSTPLGSGRRQYMFVTAPIPLRFRLCEVCAPKYAATTPLRKRNQMMVYVFSALTIIALIAPCVVFQQLGSTASPWIPAGLGLLLAVITLVLFVVLIKRAIARNRPANVAEHFAGDVVSFSPNTKTVNGQSVSDALTYTFGCDAYGVIFREMNANII